MSAVKHKEGAGRLDSGLRSNNTIFSFELSISRCRCGGSSDLVKVPQLYLDLGVIVMLQATWVITTLIKTAIGEHRSYGGAIAQFPVIYCMYESIVNGIKQC